MMVDAIESAFEALRETPRLQAAFRRWQAAHEAIGRFGEVEELLAFVRDPEINDLDAKDCALALLCEEARSGDEAARVTLLWLFIPGFLRLYQDLTPLDALDPDDLWAEMLAGFWETVTTLKTRSRMAGSLLNGARWRALKAIQEATEHASHTAPPSDAVELVASDPDDNDEDLLRAAVERGVLTRTEADLIRRTRIDGYTLEELAHQKDVSRESLRVRRQRAEAKLAIWLRRDDSSRTGIAGRDPKSNTYPRERKEVMPSAPVPHAGPPSAVGGQGP